MFRAMKRNMQAMEPQQVQEVLQNGSHGVLAVLGDDGYPYTIPLSYAAAGDEILFHSAPGGHKLDALRGCDKASFCVVAQDEVVAEKYTTFYRSVVAFGRLRELTDPAERKQAMWQITDKYSPSEPREKTAAKIDRALDHMAVLALHIEHIAGKEAVELSSARLRRQAAEQSAD